MTDVYEPVARAKADALGFVPTSTDPVRWRGKFRCKFCTVDGYISEYWLINSQWWGRRHGNKCSKRS